MVPELGLFLHFLNIRVVETQVDRRQRQVAALDLVPTPNIVGNGKLHLRARARVCVCVQTMVLTGRRTPDHYPGLLLLPARPFSQCPTPCSLQRSRTNCDAGQPCYSATRIPHGRPAARGGVW